MAKVSTTITIDSDIKAQSQALLSDLGLYLSTAVNIFLRQTLRENAIPFTISRDVPNQDTLYALEEYNKFKQHPEEYKKYSSFKELLHEVSDNA